jgi:hypothetical protein
MIGDEIDRKRAVTPMLEKKLEKWMPHVTIGIAGDYEDGDIHGQNLSTLGDVGADSDTRTELVDQLGYEELLIVILRYLTD